jgi:hypothetical protein
LSIDQGGTIQFFATVSGTSNQAVTWSLQEGSASGSITQNGLYTAPTAEMQVHVVATSVADPSKSSNSVVSVNPISLVVSPPTPSVDQGATVQFSAIVAGTVNHAVTWSIQEGSTGGSISQNGLYTAPTTEMNVHVIATSIVDPGILSKSVVSVNPVSISLPSTITVRRGGQRQVAVTVAGTVHTDVSWTVEEGASGGTITPDGMYTAPISGGPFHVTARSLADLSKAATAAVVLTESGFRMLSTSMPAPRISHTATLLPDGKVLITGGFQANPSDDYTVLSSAELFDPVTETFSATGSMSTAREGHTATLLNDGTVLVTGGFSVVGWVETVTAEIYDSTTGSFTRVGDLATARAYHTASLLADGRVLITGGLEDDFEIFSTQTAEIYDPATQRFSPAGDMPVAVASHTASVLLNGKVLVAGGSNDGCPGAQTAVSIFHPDSNSFSPGVSLPKPRVLHTATTLNDGRVLISGGIYDYCVLYGTGEPVSEVAYDTAVVFDPATSSYSPEQVMRERRWGHTATLLVDGKVLVVGSTAELFDPATSSFAITGDPYVTNVDGLRTATRLTDGRVLFVGGNSVAEIYE